MGIPNAVQAALQQGNRVNMGFVGKNLTPTVFLRIQLLYTISAIVIPSSLLEMNKMQAQWILQDAKNNFTDLVNAASGGAPQLITQQGVPAVVVLSVRSYDMMLEQSKAMKPSLSELLFAMPTDDGTFEQVSIPLRKVDF